MVITKETYLASGRFVVDKALLDDVFPVGKLKQLVEYWNLYVRLMERVHVFTQIGFLLLGASILGDSNGL